jgi:peptidoglycan hydrolase-like protein with peptidoglycan-binding domain
LIKRLIVVLAMVAGFFLLAPTEPASAALPHCGGAFGFNNRSKYPVGAVAIPTVRLGSLADGAVYCGMNFYTPHSMGVGVLQETLKRCYGQSIEPDGYFGPATSAALKNAQRIHSIPEDGAYGPQTRDTIMWWTDSWSGPHTCARFRYNGN